MVDPMDVDGSSDEVRIRIGNRNPSTVAHVFSDGNGTTESSSGIRSSSTAVASSNASKPVLTAFPHFTSEEANTYIDGELMYGMYERDGKDDDDDDREQANPLKEQIYEEFEDVLSDGRRVDDHQGVRAAPKVKPSGAGPSRPKMHNLFFEANKKSSTGAADTEDDVQKVLRYTITEVEMYRRKWAMTRDNIRKRY